LFIIKAAAATEVLIITSAWCYVCVFSRYSKLRRWLVIEQAGWRTCLWDARYRRFITARHWTPPLPHLYRRQVIITF